MDDQINHVVVLMLENRSFDQMLGALQGSIPELDGIDPAKPGTNADAGGRAYRQQPSESDEVWPDPKHETENVLKQLAGGNAGFVTDYQAAYPNVDPTAIQQVMSYFADGTLFSLHALARSFCVCHRWFSSVPGPTWANRFFVHSGTSKGRVRMPEGLIDDPRLWLFYDQDTIYDRLNEK